MIKNLIIIAIILILVGSIIFLDVPTTQSVLSLKKDIVSDQQSLSNKQDFIKVIENLIGKYQSNKEVLQNLDIILPTNSDIPNLIVQIEALANSGGIVLKDVDITVTDEKGASKAEAIRTGDTTQEKVLTDYKPVSIDLMLSGDYNSFKKFLQAIEENMRLIDVESVLFSAKTQGTGSLFEFNVVLKTYYYAN